MSVGSGQSARIIPYIIPYTVIKILGSLDVFISYRIHSLNLGF